MRASMISVELLVCDWFAEVEEKLENWLKKHKGAEVVDIKFSGKNALIIYIKEFKVKKVNLKV